MIELIVLLTIPIVCFLLVLILSDWLGRSSSVGLISDWILGGIEPFVVPADPRPEPPLRLMMYGSPVLGSATGIPEVVVLSMSPRSIRDRRQLHRNAFMASAARDLSSIPYRTQVERWWPGTDPSPIEKERLL